MQQSIISFKRRKDQKRDEAKIAATIHAMKVPYGQKIRVWKEQTALKSERSFYRALNRLGSQECQEMSGDIAARWLLVPQLYTVEE